MDVDALAAAEDTRMLVVLMDNIRAQLVQVCINPNQSRVLVARLYFVFETLRRMPDPVPTKQLQTVFQSAHALMLWMASNKVYRVKAPSSSTSGAAVEVKEWSVTLCRHFTCKPQFDALRRRLRQVWKLQSTATWESQDNEAFAADEIHNARALLNLVRTDPEAGALLREALGSIETYSELRALLNAAAQGKEGDSSEQPDDAAFGEENGHAVSQSRETQKGVTAAGSCAKMEQEVIHFFRRRQMGFWRVPFEALTPQRLDRSSVAEMALNPFSVNLLVNPSLASNPSSRQVSAQMETGVAVDVAEDGGGSALSADSHATWLRSACGAYRFLGAPSAVEELFVVVPETVQPDNSTTAPRLAGPEANAEYLTTHPEINVNFVQDIACRCGWCHTNVAEYVGGFTEKIDNCAVIEAPHAAAAANGEEDEEDVHAPTKKSFAQIPPQGYTSHEPTQKKPAALQVLPTLGMVTHEYAADGYVSLHDVLYTYKHRFSLLQCVEIILQVSDALQYILLDRGEVPKDVALAWLGISPSHVFISTVDWTVQVQMKQATHPNNSEEEKEEEEHPGEGGADGEDATSSPKQREEEEEEEEKPTKEATRSEAAAGEDASGQIDRDGVVPAILVDSAASLTDGASLVPTLSTDVNPIANAMEQLTRHCDPTAQILPISNTETATTAVVVAPNKRTAGGPTKREKDPKQLATAEWKPPVVPIFGSYVVKYSPPAPLSGSDISAREESTARLYSRWEPHPHAANPECYAVIQLFLAMLTNAVPYPQYSTQEQLLENVFEANNEVRSAGGLAQQQSSLYADAVGPAESPSFFQSFFGGGGANTAANSEGGAAFTSSGSGMVKVTIRRGMRVPGTLPKAVRELCERGLTFSTTNRAAGNGGGALGASSSSSGAMNANARGTVRRAAGNRSRAGGRTAGSAPAGSESSAAALMGSSSPARLTLEELRQFFGFVRALLLSDSFGDIDEASWWMPDKDIVDMDDYGYRCPPPPPPA